MTEREQLVRTVPLTFIEGHGYYIQLDDIPEPYRSEFAAASLGSTFEVISGHQCHFLDDWMKWLEIRFAGAV